MAYLLDANVFIQAKNLHYGLDFCPGFWDWLVDRNATGVVFSIEKVGDELEAGTDELADWAEKRGAGFFLKPDLPVIPELGRVSEWARGSGFDQGAVSTFLDVADSYLIAHASAHGQSAGRRRSRARFRPAPHAVLPRWSRAGAPPAG